MRRFLALCEEKASEGKKGGRPRLVGAELWADEKLKQQLQWWNASKWPLKDLECRLVCTIWPFHLCVKEEPNMNFRFPLCVKGGRNWMCHLPHEYGTERCWKTRGKAFFFFWPFIQYHNYTVVNLEVIDLASFSTFREKKLLGGNLTLCLFYQELLSK